MASLDTGWQWVLILPSKYAVNMTTQF